MAFLAPIRVQALPVAKVSSRPWACSLHATETPSARIAELKPRSAVSKTQPSWTGDTLLSRLVNVLIATPFLYHFMKLGARRTMIRTAEKNGVPWRERVSELSALFPQTDRESVLDSIRDDTLDYPDYYLSPFHAYDDGNLGWLQAFEVGSATRCMSIRSFGTELQAPGAVEAYERMKSRFFETVIEHAPKGWLRRPGMTVVDVGCGVGLSTRDNARRLVAHGVDLARVEGIDASPHFIAVAMKDTLAAGVDHTNVEHLVSFRHALGEHTKLDSDSIDWFSLQLVAHELPAHATRSIFQEAFRVLKPDSVFTLFDQDAKSLAMQKITPVTFTLMKSTEPFIDQFYSMDIVKELRDVGFVNVSISQTDPRHCTVVATKPC